MEKDYYEILGVDPLALPEEIHGAYRTLAKRYHPDLSHRFEKGKFIQIQEAYDILRDRDKRRKYDDRSKDTPTPDPDTHRARPHDQGAHGSPRVHPHDDLRGLFNHPGGTGGIRDGRRSELRLQLVLSPEQAFRGVSVPVALRHRRLTLGIPAGTIHGDTFRYGPGYTGLSDVDLVIRVLVRAGL